MDVKRSPEIESLMRRLIDAWQARDLAIMRNLVARSPDFRGIGTDSDEWWWSGEEFLRVREVQFVEMPPFDLRVDHVHAFEKDGVGWASMAVHITAANLETELRASAVWLLTEGLWKIIQWHGSAGIPNEALHGVEMTPTLDHLLESVATNPTAVDGLTNRADTLTLVFTDIVDSTPLVATIGDDRWAALAARHQDDVHRIVEGHGGTVVQFLGDGSMLSFGSARSAVRATVDIQRCVADQEIAVRIGLHTGEVVRSEEHVLGLTVNKAARIAAAAEGGTIMASTTVVDLVGTIDGIGFGNPKQVALKGIAGTHQIVPVVW